MISASRIGLCLIICNIYDMQIRALLHERGRFLMTLLVEFSCHILIVVSEIVLIWLLLVSHIPIVARLAPKHIKKNCMLGQSQNANLVVQNSNSEKLKEVCVMKHKLVFLVVLATILFVASVHAQFDPINLGESVTAVELSTSDSVYLEQYRGMTDSQRVARAWRHTLGRNSYSYPNPDSVQPGDEVLTPMGTYFVARPGDTDHMWHGAEMFVAKIVNPYLNGMLPIHVPKPDTMETADTTTSDVFAGNDFEMPWWVWLILACIVLGI